MGGYRNSLGHKKSNLKYHLNLFVSIAYTYLFKNTKRANFNAIGAIFSTNYSDTPSVYYFHCLQVIYYPYCFNTSQPESPKLF